MKFSRNKKALSAKGKIDDYVPIYKKFDFWLAIISLVVATMALVTRLLK